VALIDAWPDWPSTVVVIAGPVGSGKTHLGSIWREETGALVAGRAALGPDILHAVEEGGAVLIDDADAGGLDENGLFHLINAARAGQGHVLLTARRFPAGWGVALPDLKSRLAAASTVEIREPDDLLLAGVITKLFADRQVEIDPQVVQYLVKRIERSLATAIRVVDRLDRAALEAKSRITRQLAAATLNAMDAGQGALDFGTDDEGSNGDD
jgi:chromosomal replication initiation ATPase DnaA